MNRYKVRFYATCPQNGQTIEYDLTVEISKVIMAEDLVAECGRAAECEKPYHENIADRLFCTFGGRQFLRAFHHGVTIETERG